jgi:putative transcriptional regulator
MTRQTVLYGLRKEKKLSQKEMAERLDLSVASYRARETGVTDFKLSEMVVLSKFFGKTMEDIFLT